jgi:pyruvate formate lyase activating enzyme
MDSLPPIKGFLETSFLDWPKKIAAVIFLPFCNFRCPFCQNLRLIHDPHLLPNISLSHVLKRLEAWKDWIDGVCITGGEPTLHQSLPGFLRLFKERNLLVKVDTNGSNPEILESLLRDKLIDCIAMDVKAPFRDAVYSRLIGVPVNLRQIRNSIELIRNSKAEPIFRMTVVPGLLAEDDIYEVAEELRPAKHFTLQQFSPENVIDPELRKVLPWTQEKIDRIQKAVNKILRGE